MQIAALLLALATAADAEGGEEERRLQEGYLDGYPGRLTDGLKEDFKWVFWLSSVVFGLWSLVYISSGLMVAFDGMAILGMLHGLDDELKEAGITDKHKVYEACAKCEDKVVKRLIFYACIMNRAKAFFETTVGIFIWVVILTVPVRLRPAFHFANAALQLGEGFVLELQLMGVAGCGTDPGPKFGEVKKGTVADESNAAFSFPRHKFKGGFINHIVVGLISIGCGVACLVAQN